MVNNRLWFAGYGVYFTTSTSCVSVIPFIETTSFPPPAPVLPDTCHSQEGKMIDIPISM